MCCCLVCSQSIEPRLIMAASGHSYFGSTCVMMPATPLHVGPIISVASR
jgi:hypothetical protein